MSSKNPSSKGTITLVLGGVRSGKSRFAQDLATKLGENDVLFVATAEPDDSEMKRRIQHHQQSRSISWKTLEASQEVGKTVAEREVIPPVVLLDCLTLLVSNILCADEIDLNNVDDLEAKVLCEVDALIDLATKLSIHLIIVSGEVGLGLVPEHTLGRIFRDLLGFANQVLATRANATYLMMAGLAINATALATSIDQAALQLNEGAS